MARPLAGIAEEARGARCTVIVGVPAERTLQPADVEIICAPADVLMVYDNARLHQGAGPYREFVKRLVTTARGVNPKIQIEVGVATARDEAGTRAMAQTLQACHEFIDRIAIFCEDSPASYASLALLYELIRETKTPSRAL